MTVERPAQVDGGKDSNDGEGIQRDDISSCGHHNDAADDVSSGNHHTDAADEAAQASPHLVGG